MLAFFFSGVSRAFFATQVREMIVRAEQLSPAERIPRMA